MRLSFYTRGQGKNVGSTIGKQKIFFSCHKDDFEKYFNDIKVDIFNVIDVPIFFEEESSELDDIDSLLNEFSLFVFLITENFLFKECRARDVYLEFAKRNNKAILPIMVQEDLEKDYSLIVGNIQYLDKYKKDDTSVPYLVKLTKILETIFVTDEEIEKIKGAFNSSIFLSYRKKDRVYAQALMKLIHKNESYDDVAIWYDEYLTPGEDFQKEIEEKMDESSLVTIVITPNVVNEDNYILNVEYPKAKDKGLEILPVEMVETNTTLIDFKFEDIPPIVKVPYQNIEDEQNDELFLKLETVKRKTNNKDSEKLYLLGVAYLHGIEVEIDHDKGLDLLTKSAKMDNINAFEKLVTVYKVNYYTSYNIDKAIFYQIKVVEYYDDLFKIDKSSNSFEKLLYSKSDLATLYREKFLFDDAIDSLDSIIKLIKINVKNVNTYYETLRLAYFNKGLILSDKCLYKLAYECFQKAYDIDFENNRKEKIFLDLINMGESLSKFGDFENAKKCFHEARSYLAEDDEPSYYYKLASFYDSIGDYENLNYYLLEGEKIAEELFSRKRNISSLKLLGKIYMLLGKNAINVFRSNENIDKYEEGYRDYYEALECFNRCKKIAPTIDIFRLIILCLNELLTLPNAGFDKRKEVLENLDEIKKLSNSTSIKYLESTVYFYLAKYCFRFFIKNESGKKEREKQEDYFIEAIKLREICASESDDIFYKLEYALSLEEFGCYFTRYFDDEFDDEMPITDVCHIFSTSFEKAINIKKEVIKSSNNSNVVISLIKTFLTYYEIVESKTTYYKGRKNNVFYDNGFTYDFSEIYEYEKLIDYNNIKGNTTSDLCLLYYNLLDNSLECDNKDSLYLLSRAYEIASLEKNRHIKYDLYYERCLAIIDRYIDINEYDNVFSILDDVKNVFKEDDMNYYYKGLFQNKLASVYKKLGKDKLFIKLTKDSLKNYFLERDVFGERYLKNILLYGYYEYSIINYKNLGDFYKDKNDKKLAIKYYQKALDSFESIDGVYRTNPYKWEIENNLIELKKKK